MSEAESRSGPDYDEVDASKKVVIDSDDVSSPILDWTSSRTRPVQLSQSGQQCLLSSPKTNPRCSPCPEILSKSPKNRTPSPQQDYAIPKTTIQTPKCTENNTSASPQSQSTNSLSPSSNKERRESAFENESSHSHQLSPQSISTDEQQQTFNKSDSEIEGEKKSHNQTSHHKKSQEVTNSGHSKNIRLPDIKNPKSHHRSRKEAGIPVGIAVAWQRLVTSAASLSTQTTSTSSTMSLSTGTTNPKSSSATPNKLKVPQRPSSASPILPKSSKDDKRSCRNNSSNSEHGKLAGAELTVPSRPLPSSSVPPSNSVNLLANHLGNYLDHQLSYGDSIGYNSPTHLHPNHTQYADWQSNLMLPQFSQGYNNAAAVYLQQQQQQQLSLQQLHLNSHPYGYPVSSYMYGGYPPESLHQFEQFLHQQQQSDLLRHHHQQQHHQQQLLLRQQAEYEMQRRTPIPSPSPRLSIPVASPSPTTQSLLNSPSLSASNHGARATTPLPTNWSDLYHHNSSTALSPKSLTSSTPSPVTVHDFNLGFNITLSRKCATPNSLSPANITTINNSQNSICGGGKSFPFSSPFSPSLFPSKDVWKDVKKISPVSLKRKKSPPTAELGDNRGETCEKVKDNGTRRRDGLRNRNCRGSDIIDSGSGSSNDSSKVRQFADSLVVVKVEPRESDVDIDVEEQEQIKISLAAVTANVEDEGLDIVTSPRANSEGLTGGKDESLLKISKKHDFKRLESLIEKRADESVPLLTHSHSSEDSPPEVESKSRKKVKLELPEESDNGNALLTTSAQSISTSGSTTAIPLETEMERISRGKTTFQADLANNLPVNVKIKQEVEEDGDKYNDTCQNFETVPQTYTCAIQPDDNNMCSNRNVSHTYKKEGDDARIFNPQTGTLNSMKENGVENEDKNLEGNDAFTSETVSSVVDSNCNGVGKVSSTDGHLDPPKQLEGDESELSKDNALKICNELKTHDHCDFEYVDGEGMEKKGEIVPESNLPFSSSFKNSRLEEPIGTNSNCNNVCTSKSLESFVTKRNESSKNVNALVGSEEKESKLTQICPETYFDSCNQSSTDSNSRRKENESFSGSPPGVKIPDVCGIVGKIREDDTSKSSMKAHSVSGCTSDESSESEVIIRIKDGKSYLEDVDSADDGNNQYVNGNNDISTYSSQNECFGSNLGSSCSDSIRNQSSSSMLMTSEHDVDCLPRKNGNSDQIIYANQYSFNKTQAHPESIYHNRITPDDYSLTHNLISVKTSETAVSLTPDAPQVSSSDPPVTLCYLSPHPLPVQIISPQNIKIPSYIPTSGGYTTENEDGEKKYTTTVLYQQTAEPFSLYSYGSPLASPPLCDKDITSSGDDILQLRQRILPIENQQSMQIRRNSFYISPDTCIKPEDNHLDLLATVAQEFGRSDLVKVSSCLSTIGSGNSCLSAPTSLQSIVVNTSSTTNSIYSRTTDVLVQPVPAVTSVSQEPIPPAKNTSSKNHVADMFEFRSEDEDAFLKIQPLESKGYISSLTKKNHNQNQNSTAAYQPVLLKIPHIVPKAAATAAEKLKKAKLRQEKAKEKNMEKKKRASKKESCNLPGDQQLPLKMKIKKKVKITETVEEKPIGDIPVDNGVEKSEKIKIPKVKLHSMVDEKKSMKSNVNVQKDQVATAKLIKKEKLELTAEGKTEKKVKKIVLKKDSENSVVAKPKMKKIKKHIDTVKNLNGESENNGKSTEIEKISLLKQKRPSGSNEIGKEKEKPKLKLECKIGVKGETEENASVKKSLNNSDLNYINPKVKEKGKTNTKRHKTVVNGPNSGNKNVAIESDSPPKKKRKPNNKVKDLGELVNLNALHQAGAAGKAKVGKCIPMLSPSNVENEISNVHLNVNVDRDRENEYDWEANPTYAVTAIKMSNGNNKICCESTDSSLECTDKSEKKDKRKSSKPSKLTLLNSHNQTPTECSESEKILKVKSQLKSFVHFAQRRIQSGHNSHGTVPNRRHSSSSTSSRHIKPCLKAQPIVRPMSDKEDSDDSDIDLEVATLTRSISSSALSSSSPNANSHSNPSQSHSVNSMKRKAQQQKERLTNVFSRKIESETDKIDSVTGVARENSKLVSSPVGNGEKAGKVEKRGRRTSSSASLSPPKPSVNEKVEIENVTEMLDEMRILTEIQGLFYTGKLNALQPPDVYGVTLDNERGAPPHIIFSAEEVLEKCIREVKPYQLKTGLRICAYWSPQYSGLYPGKVSLDYSPTAESDLIPIEFDDGDTGVIKVGEIRLLACNHPIREYDPNPLLTLEKKHRKRRHSSTNGTSGGCTGDHEDADCGEPYCAKLAKLEEEEKEEHRSSKLLYWTWTGLGYKIPKTKKYRHKEFFRGIQRGDEVINVGDSALFISNGNDRPFIGRVERFWEKKGRKIVNVKWFYHPEEVESGKRLHGMKYAGALFESPHIDENDVQTIAKKCEVLPFKEFKERVGGLPKLTKNASPKDIYYIAGYYNPYTFKLKINDLK